MILQTEPEDIHTPVLMEVPNRIRDIIGPRTRLSSIFTPERMRACMARLEEARAESYDLLARDAQQLRQVLTAPDFALDAQTRPALLAPLCALRSQAQCFGFTFTASVAQAMINAVSPPDSAPHSTAPRQLDKLRALAALLEQTLRHRVTDPDRSLQTELDSILHPKPKRTATTARPPA